MHRDPRVAAVFLVTALGCGGSPASELTLGFAERALLEEATLIALYFYETGVQCTPLRATMPRPRSLLGPYQTGVDAQGRQRGVSFTLDEIPVGSYVVLADAINAGGGVVGSGCAEQQQVYDRQRSVITLVISRNP